jgi:Mrp family chromosome partitioning ATPase
MGRTFDSLRKLPIRAADESADGSRPISSAETLIDTPRIEVDEVPYIEVGGPGRSFEASPTVLGAKGPPKAPVGDKAPRLSRSQSIPVPPVSSSAVSEALGVVFQAVPDVPLSIEPPRKRFAHELVTFHQPEHPVCAQYRALFESLSGQLSTVSGRVILLGAAGMGAGNTTVVLNLAITCARVGQGRVAVVDANLRRPSVAERLGLSAGPGLRELLCGRVPVARALRETGQANLLAVTAGEPNTAGVPWPRGESLRSILRQCAKHCEFVFVDGPSWDGGPELASLNGACDAIYLVLRPAEVGTKPVVQLMQLIPHLGGNLGGYIVTKR